MDKREDTIRWGGMANREINGDLELTPEERRIHAVSHWRGVFGLSANASPLETFAISTGRETFSDLLASEPSASPGRHYTNVALNQLLGQYCPQGGRILDIGCGAAGFVSGTCQ